MNHGIIVCRICLKVLRPEDSVQIGFKLYHQQCLKERRDKEETDAAAHRWNENRPRWTRY